MEPIYKVPLCLSQTDKSSSGDSPNLFLILYLLFSTVLIALKVYFAISFVENPRYK